MASGRYYKAGTDLDNLCEPAVITGHTSLTSMTPVGYGNMTGYARPATGYGYSAYVLTGYRTGVSPNVDFTPSLIGRRPRNSLRFSSETPGTYYAHSYNGTVYFKNSTGTSTLASFSTPCYTTLYVIVVAVGGGGGGGGANGSYSGGGGGSGALAVGWAPIPYTSTYSSGLQLRVGENGIAGIGGATTTGTDGGNGEPSYAFYSGTLVNGDAGWGGQRGYDDGTGGAGGTFSGTNVISGINGVPGGNRNVVGGNFDAWSLYYSADHSASSVMHYGGAAPSAGGGGASAFWDGGDGGAGNAVGSNGRTGSGGGGGGAAGFDGKDGGFGGVGYIKVLY